MHELSLAQSLIDQLLGLAEEHKASQINKVLVTIGPFSGVVRDSFEFGFNALKKDHPITRAAELELETPDPVYLCLDCDKVSVIPFSRPSSLFDQHSFSPHPKKCPWCGLNRLSPKGGKELLLNHVEME